MTTATLPLLYIDCILVFILMEWLVLGIRYKVFQRGLSFKESSLGLLPGFFLILGIRTAAPVDVPIEVFGCLALSGVAHALDFYSRHKSLR